MKKTFRGITSTQETRPADSIRNIRPFWQQVRDLLLSRYGATGVLSVFAVMMFIAPSFSDVFLLIAITIFWFSFWDFKRLPFRMPIFARCLDKNDPKPGSERPGKAAGIYYFGWDVNTQEQLWFNNTDMRTHTLIFGSTGSGKTESLLSLAYNAIIQGSGLIYVDGKGDNSLFAKMFSLVRSKGREDDLLVVNFMTGANDISGPQEHIISNTMNPFASGSSSMLSQLVISLMDSSGGAASSGNSDGDMWKGRAMSFVEALMRPLVWLRDREYLLLEAGVIRRYFVLDVLEEMLYDRKVVDQNGDVTVLDEPLPADIRESLESYLSTLPGYQRSEKGKQDNKAYEQHGYITMQLTRIFNSLADVYGHIIRTNLAEVDFRDVVLNRRILVVLLPALEKSPDELSNLGKLIIASLKAMLAEGLGNRVEGDYADVIETKPTNSKTPYLCVLDEYGYYAVKGFAVVPAQARSLGFSVVFAGQDLPAFQKASKEEASSICANTNIKICMKLEDPADTWEFFQKTAGEAYVSVARTYARTGDGPSVFSYRDTLEANIDKRHRLDLLDLKDQREGEAHIFFKSKIVRCKMFYANPPRVKQIKLNQFLKVKPPSNKVATALSKLRDLSIDPRVLGQIEGFDPATQDFFESLKESSLTENVDGFLDQVLGFLGVETEEEELNFIEETDNPSIFMSIPVDERLSSDFFDVTTSNLQESTLTKDKIYEVVKRLNILEGKSERISKQEALDIIHEIEEKTAYKDSMPPAERSLIAEIDTLVQHIS